MTGGTPIYGTPHFKNDNLTTSFWTIASRINHPLMGPQDPITHSFSVNHRRHCHLTCKKRALDRVCLGTQNHVVSNLIILFTTWPFFVHLSKPVAQKLLYNICSIQMYPKSLRCNALERSPKTIPKFRPRPRSPCCPQWASKQGATEMCKKPLRRNRNVTCPYPSSSWTQE